MIALQLIFLVLFSALPASIAAPGRGVINNLSESFEHVADSDVDASSETEEEDEELPLMPNPQKDFNLADHIKPKKGEKNVIGGKFKCDSNGCHAVDEEVFDESL